MGKTEMLLTISFAGCDGAYELPFSVSAGRWEGMVDSVAEEAFWELQDQMTDDYEAGVVDGDVSPSRYIANRLANFAEVGELMMARGLTMGDVLNDDEQCAIYDQLLAYETGLPDIARERLEKSPSKLVAMKGSADDPLSQVVMMDGYWPENLLEAVAKRINQLAAKEYEQ